MKKRKKIKVSVKKKPIPDYFLQDYIKCLKGHTPEIYDYLKDFKYNGEKYNRTVNVDCNGKPLETK